MASFPNPAMGGGGGASPLMGIIQGALSKRTQDAASPTPGAPMAENAGADDGMVLAQLNKIHEALGLVFVRTMTSRPNVANAVSATMKQLSRAIKEAQQGANVSEVVGKTEESQQPKPPINFSAAAQGTGRPDMPSQE
jgi:hypothetical protein